ncbi:MAG: hypothetical protein RLZZ622_88, partial [Planctomycetota bacterium]
MSRLFQQDNANSLKAHPLTLGEGRGEGASP